MDGSQIPASRTDASRFATDLPRACGADSRTGDAYAGFAQVPRGLQLMAVRMFLFISRAGATADPATRAAMIASAKKAHDGFRLHRDVMAARTVPAGLHPAGHAWIREIVDAVPGFQTETEAMLKRGGDMIALAEAGRLADTDVADFLDFAYGSHQQPIIGLAEQAEEALEAYRRRRADEAKEAADSARRSVRSAMGIARAVGIISLNASVEAARSGEAGRSFAVIAAEIKRLSVEATSTSRDVATAIDRTIAALRE